MSNTTSLPPYAETFDAARSSILEILKNGSRLSSSEIYARIDYGSAKGYENIRAGINALNFLISEKVVTDTHEMVGGFVSTHFHTLA